MTEGLRGRFDGIAAQQHHPGSPNKPDHSPLRLALLGLSLQDLNLHGFLESLTA